MSLVIRSTGWEDYMDPAGGSWVKELILGAPDVGKTRSASFWPKPIFADCEDGRMSLADRKVPYGRVRSTADMDALITQLQFDCKRPPEKRKYQTLVLDTVDHFQKIIISERLRSEGKEALSGWADWGWLDAKMQQYIEKLLNLEMNIVVNCHFKNVAVGDDDEKSILQELRLKGDVKSWLLEEFDLIGMMESYYIAEKGDRVRKRRIRWHNEPAFPLLKDRSGSLPAFTDVDFTTDDYSRVFDALMSKVDALPESEELETLETTEETATDVPGPDVEGGPVDPGKLPVKKVAAKRVVAKKAPAKVRDAAPGEAVVTQKAELGTREVPVVVDPNKAKVENFKHVHAKDGTCLRNLWGPDCGAKTSAEAEAPGNPASAEAEQPKESKQQPKEQPKESKESATEVSTDVPTSSAAAPSSTAGDKPVDATPAEAEANVKEVLGGEAVRPDRYCGKQPSSHAKFDQAPGCGKDLKDEIPAKVNLSLLRAKTMLCTDCFTSWKSTQETKKTASTAN